MDMLSLLLVLGLVAAINGLASQEFIQDVVDQHNYYRRKHGAPDVEENAEISKFAQAWADDLASRGAFEHNWQVLFNGYGENLSGMWPTATGKDHVNNLYIKEAKFYADNKYCGGEPDSSTFHSYGHYTQIVWKNTQQIGVGEAGGIVVVNYSPPGNYRGRYTENVPCPTS